MTPAAAWRTRLGIDRWRLSSRMVLVSLVLLLVVQAASLLVTRANIDRNARQQLDAQLQVGARIWTRLLEQRGAKLAQSAELLAADYGFRSAVGSHDRATIASALDNHGERIGAEVALLLDTQMRVKVAAQDLDDGVARAVGAIAPMLRDRGGTVVMVGQQPMQFVMAPMRSPLVIGWVLMGFPLGSALVDDLQAVSGLHASLVLRPPGQPSRLLYTSLPADSAARELSLADVTPESSSWSQHGVPVSSGPDGSVVLQLAAPLEQAIAPYRDLEWLLGGLTLLGLVLFGAGNAWSARRVTRPLSSLVHASDRLGRGEYDVPLQGTGRGDEIGDLARAFEHMRTNIAANEREIRQLAYWDRLTGLPNRLQFRDAVGAQITAASGTGDGLAVVMLDLDRFKHVNDVLGYAFGDQVLKVVAERLHHAVRDGDMIARLSGDEFALLLPQADADAAQAVADRIASVFASPLTLEDQMVDLSAAVGIACWPAHAAEADTLLSRAEVAMYAAKRSASGAMRYDARLDNASTQTLSLLSELRRAVEGGELRLFLQPKVTVADGALCGAEALVRWQHPSRGLVPPMEFIPFAEQTGFVRRLTLWMFEEAASQRAMLSALGVQRVSVNLSTRDLLDLELPEKLDAILKRHGATATGFCLEITESAIMDDPDRAEATINRLAARGFKLSIDDFGTGYSSLAYLKRLPVDELKIDKSFVMGMVQPDGEDGDAKIVRSTVDLAHNLGLSVVAEGVENAEILDQLYELGCDEAQGYHLSRPLPVDAFVAWARAWTPPPAQKHRSPPGLPLAGLAMH
ncbi:MAG: EAL domain-containing protein [Rubrivivax sp.]|jgi:diguanylate cyclase (GGDEF)-like protein|nr:EAL domain-containing protein [Rubrivivax sp.]